MYNEEYDDEEEEQSSENFFVNFYNNNKVLVWIFLGIIIFLLLMTLLTRGGSSKTTITYDVEISPPGDVFVAKGRSAGLEAKVKNDPKAKFSWMSEDETVATIDNSGNITGIGYGTTSVILTYIDPTGNKQTIPRGVTVGDGDPNIPLNNVAFKEGDLFMPLNAEYEIRLMIDPTHGYITSEQFTSDDPNIVTVDNNGVVRSVGTGHTVVSFNVNNNQFKGKLDVYVDENCTSTEIIVTPSSISFDGVLRKIKVGTVENLSYTVVPQNTDLDRLTWRSSDESHVTVEKGQIKGIAEGSATITVTALNGQEAKIDVEVESDVIEVSDISLPVGDIYLTVGQSETITPIISPDNASNKALSYTIIDSTYAYVSPNETGTQATITGYNAGTTELVIKSISMSNPVEKRVNVIVTGSSDNGGGSSGGGGGSSGGGGGSSTSNQGFKISSKDANGKGYVNATYDKTKPIDNGAKAPVEITVQKTDSSVSKLVILVCNYADSSTSCGSLGKYETTDKTSFTLKYKGEYVIRVDEYDSKNNKTRTTDKFLYIKEGPEGSGSSTTTSYYKVSKTLYSTQTEAAAHAYTVGTTVKFTVVDSTYGYIKICKRVAGSGDTCVNSTVTGSKTYTFNETGTYQIVVDKYRTGSTTSQGKDYLYIYIKSSGSTGAPTATPKPTSKTTPSATTKLGRCCCNSSSNPTSCWWSTNGSCEPYSTYANVPNETTCLGLAKTTTKPSVTASPKVTATPKPTPTPSPKSCSAPTNITISVSGKVSWPKVANATKYQIQVNSDSNNASSSWTDVSGTEKDFLNTITLYKGERYVRVRAYCGPNSISSYKQKGVRVFTLTLTKDEGIKTVSSNRTRYIQGAQVKVSANVNDGYTFVGWKDTSTNIVKYSQTSYQFNISQDTTLKATSEKVLS